MTAQATPVPPSLRKSLAILIAAVGVGIVLWPSYRKFFIDEWRERFLAGEPVLFLPDCPNISDKFKCADQYAIVFRREGDRWCASVRKNREPDGIPVCGIDPDARDFSRYWRYFSIDDTRLYYSWRGRALIPGVGYVGWLATPNDVAARAAHPLSID
jgi:hypothetical protein